MARTNELKERLKKIIAAWLPLLLKVIRNVFLDRYHLGCFEKSTSKDINDLGDHPDDEEPSGDSESSLDSLSELSAGTLVYDPQVESLKDQKLKRLVEQMKSGMKGGDKGQAVAPEKKSIQEQTPGEEWVSEKKDEKQLNFLGEQLKILVEKAQRHAQSKQGIPYTQELPGHASRMNLMLLDI